MHLRLRIVALLLTVAIAPAASAESDCPVSLGELADLDWDEMEDVVLAPGCSAIREPLAARIDDMIAAGNGPEDADEDGLHFFSMLTAGIQLNAALWRRDLNASHEFVEKLQQQFDAVEERERLAEEAEDSVGTPDEESPSAFLDDIAAVLAGAASRNVPQRLQSPESDWLVRPKMCGYNLGAVAMPSRADAWVAMGAPEVGLQWLLVDQWVDALSYGGAPPRLREFAERAFGAGAYETEIERALASIRIEDTPTGRHAGMRLFGMWVPLPIGQGSWREEEDLTAFEDEADIAEFLRPLLLPEQDSD